MLAMDRVLQSVRASPSGLKPAACFTLEGTSKVVPFPSRIVVGSHEGRPTIFLFSRPPGGGVRGTATALKKPAFGYWLPDWEGFPDIALCHCFLMFAGAAPGHLWPGAIPQVLNVSTPPA